MNDSTIIALVAFLVTFLNHLYTSYWNWWCRKDDRKRDDIRAAAAKSDSETKFAELQNEHKEKLRVLEQTLSDQQTACQKRIDELEKEIKALDKDGKKVTNNSLLKISDLQRRTSNAEAKLDKLEGIIRDAKNTLEQRDEQISEDAANRADRIEDRIEEKLEGLEQKINDGKCHCDKSGGPTTFGADTVASLSKRTSHASFRSMRGSQKR